MEEDMIIFEICHELLLTGKPGRPKKTLKKGVTVRVNLSVVSVVSVLTRATLRTSLALSAWRKLCSSSSVVISLK